MKYRVYVSELRYGQVVLEADNPSEAEAKAQAGYESGSVSWHETELTDTTAEEE